MKRIGTLILTLLFILPTVSAQRVGVVFSGGGAKGLYHIGILKALEENEIPIDYIAGTSMGAIIGGLYAIGYTPDEIAGLFLSKQVDLWMSGRIEQDHIFYFNRMKPRMDMVSVPLDFKAEKNIAVLPTNVIPSTQIDMAFNEIFAPATAYTKGDFNRLLVPFRCIASDINDKKEAVFRRGDIGRAIRASMAIPLGFEPILIDSVLYYDGGMQNNFPWQPLEEDFHPDIFIGGKCIKNPKIPDQNNLIDLIEALTMNHTDFNLPEGRGILIERVLDNVNMLDFSRAQYIINLGYTDAMAQMDSIKTVIPRRQNPAELHHKRLMFRSRLPELIFNDYRIQGLSGDQNQYVHRTLGLDKEEFRTFDFKQFKSAYFKTLSGGEIIGDYPEMAYNDTSGYFSVKLPLRTKPSFRVKFGGNISSTALQQAYFGLEYKTIAKRTHSLYFDGNFSAMYTSARPGWRTDFYLKMPVYFELNFNYNDYNYQRGPNWATFEKYGYLGYKDTYLSASLGIPWGRNSVVQARFNLASDIYEYYERDYIPSAYGSFDRTKFRFYGLQLDASYRTLNHPLYPTRGIFQDISAIFINGEERFLPGENFVPKDEAGRPMVNENNEVMTGHNPYAENTARRWIGIRYTREQYYSLSRWFSLGYHVEGVFTTRPEFYTEHATNYISPGFTPTPYTRSLYMNKLRSPYYVGAGIIPTIEFGNNFYLKNSLHLLASENFFEKGTPKVSQIRYILNSSLVYQTPIGPASLTVTNFKEASRKWFIVFNFGFAVFGNRGLFF